LLGGAGRHRGRHCQPADRPPPAAGRCVMKRRMNGYLLAGLIVTGLMAALILVGLVWTPYDPDALLAGPKLEGPSLAHWLGTDSFGRDIFSRVLQGAGTTFLIALSTVAIGAVCGTAAGALTGYFGGV
ncbi:Regulatory protein BlaI, partial [Dysosmobacter welbionis]